MGRLRPFLVSVLLLLLPANALFLAGQAEQGGPVSILCENQSQAFVSSPEGDVRALALDSDFQASFLPQEGGPHTIACGRETQTIQVSMQPRGGAPAFSGNENIFPAAAALAFLAALVFALRLIIKPRTEFSKSSDGGTVRLRLRAGEGLRDITITDPQGGEEGKPLKLSVPRLAAGARWEWEYEPVPIKPPFPARMSARTAKGNISLLSNAGGKDAPGHKIPAAKNKERKKLAKFGA